MKKIAIIIAMALVASLSAMLPVSANVATQGTEAWAYVYDDPELCLEYETDDKWWNVDSIAVEYYPGIKYRTASGIPVSTGYHWVKDLKGIVQPEGPNNSFRIYFDVQAGYHLKYWYPQDEFGYYFELEFPNDQESDRLECHDARFRGALPLPIVKPIKPARSGNVVTIPQDYPPFRDFTRTRGYFTVAAVSDGGDDEWADYGSKITLKPGDMIRVCQSIQNRRFPLDKFTDFDGAIREHDTRACWGFSNPHPNAFSLPTGKLNTKKATVSLPIQVRTSGKVKVSGSGIKTTTKSVGKSGKVTITVKPTSKTLKAMKKSLKKKKTVTKSVKVKATYYPKSGPSYTVYKTYKLTLKRK